MNDRDIGYAIDILIACRQIEQFGADRPADSLSRDAMYQAAVLRKLEIIGEVAKRLSNEFKSAHAHINWKGWAGLRDRLIHGYDDVNLDIVQTVLSDELPRLMAALKPYGSNNR